MRRAPTVVFAALAALTPRIGSAGPPPFIELEHKWCVDSAGPGASFLWCAGPSSCSGEFTTVAAAVAAARAEPDPDPTDPPAHNICVGTQGAHTESLVIDNTDNALGEYVGVEFSGALGVNWCDDAAPGELSGIVLVGGGGGTYARIEHLRTDDAVCERTRPLVETSNQNFSLSQSVVQGGVGPVISSTGGDIGWTTTDLNLSLVSGIEGQVLVSESTALITNTEVSGCTTSTGPLLETTGLAPSGAGSVALEISSAVLFGNVLHDNPLIRSLDRLAIGTTSILANVAINSPLLVLQQGSLNGGTFSGIGFVEIAGNRLLASGAIASAAPYSFPLLRPTENTWNECLPEGSLGIPIEGRPTPDATGVPSGAEVLGVGTAGSQQDTRFTVSGSWFVGNEIGVDGSLIRVSGSALNPTLILSHNVFDESVGATLSGGEGFGGHLSLSRNLVLGTARMDLGPGWGSIEAALDVVEGTPAWPDWTASQDPLVVPPITGFDRTQLMSAATVMNLSDCERARLYLPARPECSESTAGFSWCPLGAGSGYHLDEAAALALDQEWPWSGTTLAAAPSGACRAPGPGGPCAPLGGADSDTDDYTDIFDCDDEDPSVVPELPQYHGFGMPWCEQPADGCFICPPGSCWPPGEEDCPELPGGDDDDDSSTGDDDTTADDDDSGVVDDDDSTQDDDDDDETPRAPVDEVPVGCHGRGCGAALEGNGPSVVMLMGPLWWWPRRQRDDCA